MIRTRPFVSITLFACCLFCCLTGKSCEKASEVISNDGEAVNKEPADSESVLPMASEQDEYKQDPQENGSERQQEQVYEPRFDSSLIFNGDSDAAPLQHLRRSDESEAFIPARFEEEVSEQLLLPLYGRVFSRKGRCIQEDGEREAVEFVQKEKLTSHFLTVRLIEGCEPCLYYYINDEF